MIIVGGGGWGVKTGSADVLPVRPAEQLHAVGVAIEGGIRLAGGGSLRRGLGDGIGRLHGWRRRSRYLRGFAGFFLFQGFLKELGLVQRRADEPGYQHGEVGGLPVEMLFLTGSDAQHAMHAVGHQGNGHQPLVPGLPERGQAVQTVAGEVRDDDLVPSPDDLLAETVAHVHG